jgi:hypothetical protein
MQTPTTDYTRMRLDEMEAAYGGIFIRARASLGITAFGMQVLELPPDSGDFAPEHDHARDGQEECYLLLRGSGHIALPGGRIELDPETFVRVAPGARRRLRSGPDGARILVIGGIPGAAYQPAANSQLGGPEGFLEGASSAALPDGPPPELDV